MTSLHYNVRLLHKRLSYKGYLNSRNHKKYCCFEKNIDIETKICQMIHIDEQESTYNEFRI